jgi:hypothetical protein
MTALQSLHDRGGPLGANRDIARRNPARDVLPFQRFANAIRAFFVRALIADKNVARHLHSQIIGFYAISFAAGAWLLSIRWSVANAPTAPPAKEEGIHDVAIARFPAASYTDFRG